jgi:hypothetical protein
VFLEAQEWDAAATAAAAGGVQQGAADGPAALQQQVLMLQQQLANAAAGGAGAGAGVVMGAGGAVTDAAGLQQHLGHLSQWLAAQQALLPSAGFGARRQAKRRKQERPSRAPFYAVHTGGVALYSGALPRRFRGGGGVGSRGGCGSDGDGSDAGAAKRVRLGAGDALGAPCLSPGRACAAAAER